MFNEAVTVVEVRLLGPLEVDVDGRILDVRRQKQRALLALLALRAGEVVPTDRLVDELWGDEPPKAAVGSLQNFVSELRKMLGAEVLVTRSPGYLLDIPRDAVDVHRFERIVREAAREASEQRAASLREALGLWRGPALADVQLEDAMVAEAARLEESRVAAWEDRLEAELELGRQSQVIGELESLVAKHPLRERPVGLLMLALYRGGRQADALDAYRRSRERLVEELGIDPSPELQRLEQAILRHDKELDLPEAPRKRVPASEPDRRKTVTILFADLVDSTELGARLDPEVLRRVLDRYFELVRAAIERHGGVVEKFIGDAAMAVFGIPAVHEDDALRAVRAACELREALAEPSETLTGAHGIPLQVRVGVNTGEVLVRAADSGESFATGAAVNIAARLEQAAIPGEILIGEATYRLVQHAVESEPVDPVDLGGALGRASVFRVGGVGEAAPPLGRAALVGREDELAWLQAAFAGVQAERRSRVVTVLGEPGVGKSRLAREFAASAGELPLVGRCVSYGDGATFLPLAQIVRKALPERPRAAILALLEGDDQASLVAERVTHLTEPADGAASTGEVFWAVRRFLEALARERPVLVLLEDIHWAEPTLLDLIEYLDSWPAEAALLVACLARGELLEERPGWGSRNGILALEPLAEKQAGTLVEEVAAGAVDEEAQAQIVRIAAGNPLFLEQLLAFVQEAGPSALGAVPPTIEALLAGRLERLDPAERVLTERASVAGRDFSRGGLIALSPPDDLAGLDSRLRTLVRRGLVRALRGGDDDTYRFHHVLVRDVAYAGTTKDARAELHDRFGTWLEQRGRAADELVGYHLEQAHRYRKELDPGDPGVVGLAERAGRVLGAAGIGAWKRADARAAANLLGRAASLLPAGEPKRAEILCELGMTLGQLGDSAPPTPRSPRQLKKPRRWATTCLRHGRESSSHAHDCTAAATPRSSSLSCEPRPRSSRRRKTSAPSAAPGARSGTPAAPCRDAARTGSTPPSVLDGTTGDPGGPPPAACPRPPPRCTTVPRPYPRRWRCVSACSRKRRIVRERPTSSHTSRVYTPATGAETKQFASSMKRTTCTATSRTTTAWQTRVVGSAVASTPWRRIMRRLRRHFELAARRLSASTTPPRSRALPPSSAALSQLRGGSRRRGSGALSRRVALPPATSSRSSPGGSSRQGSSRTTIDWQTPSRWPWKRCLSRCKRMRLRIRATCCSTSPLS